MDLGRSFSYIFDDEEWGSKVLMAAVLMLIPIANFAVYGWVVELIRNMLDGYEHPMPDWSNFGDKFQAGLAYFVGSLVYNIPLMVIMIPMMFIAAATENTAMEGLAMALMCLLTAGIFVYAIVANAGVFIGMIRYALNPQLSVYLEIARNLRLALHHVAVLVTLFLFMLLVGLIFSVFGWIPCIGWLAALALGTPVYGHLAGQAAIQIVGQEKRKRAEI
ncbi:MAG: DUF4013 domain-containing protein [Anaerolineae bacterium]|nr:DUF4013 domain-containing protein [Anaerolineae bacterium]